MFYFHVWNFLAKDIPKLILQDYASYKITPPHLLVPCMELIYANWINLLKYFVQFSLVFCIQYDLFVFTFKFKEYDWFAQMIFLYYIESKSEKKGSASGPWNWFIIKTFWFETFDLNGNMHYIPPNLIRSFEGI